MIKKPFTDMRKMEEVVKTIIWTYMDGEDCFNDVVVDLANRLIPNCIPIAKIKEGGE